MSEVKRYAFFAYIDEGDNAEFDYHIEPDGSWVKASDYDQLKAENERLKCVVERLHGELYEELKRRFEGNRLASEEYHRDTLELRKQLDEARELLTVASEIIHEQAMHIDRPMTDLGSEALTRIDDWLESNP